MGLLSSSQLHRHLVLISMKTDTWESIVGSSLWKLRDLEFLLRRPKERPKEREKPILPWKLFPAWGCCSRMYSDVLCHWYSWEFLENHSVSISFQTRISNSLDTKFSLVLSFSLSGINWISSSVIHHLPWNANSMGAAIILENFWQKKRVAALFAPVPRLVFSFRQKKEVYFHFDPNIKETLQ